MELRPEFSPDTIRSQSHTYILSVPDGAIEDAIDDPPLFNFITEEILNFKLSQIIFDQVGLGTIYKRQELHYTVTPEQAVAMLEAMSPEEVAKVKLG